MITEEHCCICHEIIGDVRTFVKTDREGIVEEVISPVCDRCAEVSPMLDGYLEDVSDGELIKCNPQPDEPVFEPEEGFVGLNEKYLCGRQRVMVQTGYDDYDVDVDVLYFPVPVPDHIIDNYREISAVQISGEWYWKVCNLNIEG